MSSPPALLVYRGYGTRYKVCLQGHVLDDPVVYEAQKGEKRRKTIRAAIWRYLSIALPDIHLEVTFAGSTKKVVTDTTGAFSCVFEFSEPLSSSGWQTAHYKVLDEFSEPGAVTTATGDVLIIADNQNTGVISDIDDTVLISYSTEPYKKLRLVLLKNAYTRMPFENVGPFYSALHTGAALGAEVPFFYVSSSEWNLYDFLEDFFREKQLPKGPFFLKELETNPLNLLKKHTSHNHKYLKAEHLIQTFPGMEFVLIGDSGQQDVDIYSRLAQNYPGRIRFIMIRAVSTPGRHEQIRKQATQLAAVGIRLYLVKDTGEAWKIAAEEGLLLHQKIAEAD